MHSSEGPNEGADVPIYQTKLPEARHLEDLFGIYTDIVLVNESLQRLLDLQTPDNQKAALFSAALMAYRRCFNSGVRHHLKHEDAESLPDDVGGFHKFLLAQANKLIAHSVNPFEKTNVGFVVRDGKIIGVGRLTARLIAFDEAQTKQWGRLLTGLFEQVLKPRIAAAEAALLIAGRKLPIVDIQKMPRLQISTLIQNHEAHSRRS